MITPVGQDASPGLKEESDEPSLSVRRRLPPSGIGGLGSVGCTHSGESAEPRRFRTMRAIATATAVDPCWPERYNYAARHEVIAPFAQQVEQRPLSSTRPSGTGTSKPGTDKLTPGGMEKLDSMAQARRHPIRGSTCRPPATWP